MTVEEFKKLNPEFAHLEGDSLWNAMEDYMLTIQQGEEIIRPILPFWKKYTLRWMFYRKLPTLIMGKNGFQSSERCSSCKYGVSTRLAFISNGKMISFCPKCNKEYKGEPNTNFSYKSYRVWVALCNCFWNTLDFLRIIRSSHHGRYDMFGDEARYVKSWCYDKDWNKKDPIMKTRKWWEYIFIEKPKINI